jgi:hypothetical protein
MYVKLNGEMSYLWRAVDGEGEVLESYVTKTLDKAAALANMNKTLKRHGSPEAITTDGWRSYGAAMDELGRCGLGTFPLKLPKFSTALLNRARAERGYFVTASSLSRSTTAHSLWDEMLMYVRSHPSDARAPEALYRLIRVARWGGNHNHLGRRAFRLLHGRNPRSPWAKRSPYYYDWGCTLPRLAPFRRLSPSLTLTGHE